MVDFEAPEEGRKGYEEVWRDEVLSEGERVAVVLETDGGCVVRVGEWCQGILKVGGEGEGREVEGWEEGVWGWWGRGEGLC